MVPGDMLLLHPLAWSKSYMSVHLETLQNNSETYKHTCTHAIRERARRDRGKGANSCVHVCTLIDCFDKRPPLVTDSITQPPQIMAEPKAT